MSTDEIMPAGAQVLPYRSNISKLADFVYTRLDPDKQTRCLVAQLQRLGHIVTLQEAAA